MGFLQILACCFRHCERSELSAEAQRAKAEAIHSCQTKADYFAAEPVITVRAQLRSSRGAHSRDPLDPLRKRFAFVAGNDGLDRKCRLNSKY
jgi:hypothetical protein